MPRTFPCLLRPKRWHLPRPPELPETNPWLLSAVRLPRDMIPLSSHLMPLFGKAVLSHPLTMPLCGDLTPVGQFPGLVFGHPILSLGSSIPGLLDAIP